MLRNQLISGFQLVKIWGHQSQNAAVTSDRARTPSKATRRLLRSNAPQGPKAFPMRVDERAEQEAHATRRQASHYNSAEAPGGSDRLQLEQSKRCRFLFGAFNLASRRSRCGGSVPIGTAP